MDKYNLFRFAPGELSHSAVWAWILQSLDATQSERAGVRALAEEFVRWLRAPEAHADVTVKTEHWIGAAGRLDIWADIGSCIIVIENKVSAIPSREQVERYLRELKAGKEEVVLCLMSASFDEDVRTGIQKLEGVRYCGLSELVTLVEPHRATHPLLGEYAEWLTDLRERRELLARQALSDDLAQVQQALSKAEGQWALLRALGRDVPGDQHRGTNLDGTPWTQLRFHPHSDALDALFYRVDRSKRGAYLAVRQWQPSPSPSIAEKQERLRWLRTDWDECCREVGMGLRSGRARGRGQSESEIGVFYLSENPPSVLLGQLPKVHERFAARLRDRGWTEVHTSSPP